MKASLTVLGAMLLAGAMPARAALVGVEPAPGSRLGPGQYIRLQLDPPMSQAELEHLDDLIEIRDERHGRMYWFAAGVGNPPYAQVVLVPDDNWHPGGVIRLEMMADPALPDGTLPSAHFRWPFLCDGCEWLGTRPAWSHTLQESAGEDLDILPLDMDRLGLADLAVARRELLVFTAVDTCAATPQLGGLGGSALGNYSLDRMLQPITLGNSAAGELHPGEGLILHTRGQNEGVRVLARTGQDDAPEFAPLQLTDGSFDGSPLLAVPVRLAPDRLCQDLLVGTRGGDLVRFPAADGCAQLDPGAAQVLFSGLGLPLDLALSTGLRPVAGGFDDHLFVLDASPTPLRALQWDGTALEESWSAPPDLVQGLERLETWSDGDAAGLPDVVAWSPLGRVVVVRNVDAAGHTAQLDTWECPGPLRDVEALSDGRLLLAGHHTVWLAEEPASGGLRELWTALPDVPRRLRVEDVNGDGDHDVLLLYEDGLLEARLDEPMGSSRLALPDPPVVRALAVGDTLELPLVMRHRGGAGVLRVDVPAPPAEEGFPFRWDPVVGHDLAPGDSLVVLVAARPSQPVDSCWSGALQAQWTVPGCPGQSGILPLELCLQAGLPRLELSADSLEFGPDCGGHSSCGPECPRQGLWLRNTGDALLRLVDLRVEARPGDSQSSPASFCLIDSPPAGIEPGDSVRVELAFCPPMTEPWPWRQTARLAVSSNGPGADSLAWLPLAGTLSCLWPPSFAGDLPASLEDVPGWLDLAPLVVDPDDDLAELALTVHGLVGTGGHPADSLLRLDEVDGLRLRITPGAHVNSALWPELGLDLELADPSGNRTRDTLLFRIQPVDDPVVVAIRPDSVLTVREGRSLRLEFAWTEVDGDPLEREFALWRDAARTQLVESAALAGDGSGSWERAFVEGDSARFAGGLWWSLRLDDTVGGAGFSAEAAGRLVLTTRRDRLVLDEDREIVLDVGDWLLSPGEDASGMQASLLDVLGTGAQEADSVLRVEALGGLLFRLSPGADVNSDRYPALALLFQLQEAGAAPRNDTLRVLLTPVDDDPRLLSAPEDGLELPEAVETALSWSVDEVDGHALAGGLLISTRAQFGDTLAWLPLPADGRLSLGYRPEPGDSLRQGGRLHWRLEVADQAPGGGQLSASRALILRQAGQDLQLALRSAPRLDSFWGDTLALDLRIHSATGYVGPLVLRLRLDLQEAGRAEYPWLELAAGASLDTSFTLVMPLSGAQSCWRATLEPGNPAEDPGDNELEACVTLGREPVGPATRGFSPNGDGVNDTLPFVFSARPARSRYRVEIFDAGGRRLVGHDLVAGEHSWSWDGRSGGRPVLPGVYAWILLDGGDVLAKGELGVVR